MLNFKVGTYYTDTEGNQWLFCYYNDENNGYIFYSSYYDETFSFNEYFYEYFYEYFSEDCPSVHTCIGKQDVIIHFIENPDEWVIGREYDAINLNEKTRFKVKFIKRYDYEEGDLIRYISFKDADNQEICLRDCGDTAIAKYVSINIVVFKYDIRSILKWKEIKKKSKKPICFEIGEEYARVCLYNSFWECVNIFEIDGKRKGVFYNLNTRSYIASDIEMIDSVEFTIDRNKPNKTQFIADEKYRDEIDEILSTKMGG